MSSPGDREWLDRMLMLLPGFLTLGLACYVGAIGEPGDFALTLYSLALNLVIYALADGLAWSWRRLRQKFRGSKAQSEARTGRAPLALVVTVSVFLGIGLGWAYQSDILLRVIRWMPGGYQVTVRSAAGPLTFLLSSNRTGTLEEGRPDALKQREAWLEVTLEDEGTTGGRRIAGYPEFFSMQSDKGEVFLSPACVERAGAWKRHEGPGLVFRKETVRLVALIDRETHPCPKLWADIANPSPPQPAQPSPPAP